MSFRLKVEMHRGPLRLHIDRELPTDRITGVFGPSGAGKTTLLRCIAGFERPPMADIRLGNECWQDSQAGVFLPPHRRSVATVFQEPRLFPHLDVAGNLAYAVKRSASQGPDFDEVVRLLGLRRLLDRKISELSGGEARRVAVARALLRGPGMLLMDEPTANLDEHHKRELLRFLLRAQKSLGIPVIYVSHDIEELCWLVDDLLILEDGIVTGSGDLGAVLARANLPMIGRREAGVILEARVLDYDTENAVSRLQFDGGELLVAGKVADGVQRLRVRADEVSLAIERPRPSSILNVLEGTVREISQDQEASVLVAVDVGSSGLLARVSIRSSRELGLQPGTPVYAQVKGIAVRDMSG